MAKSKSTSPGQELLSAAAANATAEPVVTETPPPAPPDVAATTEATTPETVTETPPSPPQPDFLESLRSVGFENVTSAEEAQQRLLEAYRTQQERYQQLESRVKEIEPLANYGREYIQHLRTPPPQPAAPKQEAQPADWWSPPKVDPGLVQKYRAFNPETGQQEWSRETPAAVRAQAEEYQTYIEQWTNNLIYNPKEALKSPIRREVEEYLEEVFGVSPKELPERLDISGEQRVYNDLLSQYGDRIFPRNPVTQKPDYERLTPYGEALRAGLEEAQQYGLPTEARVRYAVRLAESTASFVAPQQQTQQVQAKREDNRRDLARRSGATGIPDRGGSEATTTRKQNVNMSPGQELLAQLNGSVT